ncbi:MAG: NINE protein [bacterium]|nr:NINE protein [bacterium]
MSTALRVLVRHGNDNYGPYTVAELNSMLDAGRVQPRSLAWIEGAPEWQELHTIPGVQGEATAPAMAAPPPGGHATHGRHDDNVSDRLALPAFLLAFFLGPFGIHRFYVGKTGSGIAMLVLTVTLVGAIISGIWSFVDWIVIACGGFRDGEGRLIRNWT